MKRTTPKLRLVGSPRQNLAAPPASSPATLAHRDFIEYLFERYRPVLSRYLRRVMDAEEDVNEVLQETYLRVVRTDQVDRLESKARAYLFTIARNLVRDRFRHDRIRSPAAHLPFDEYMQPSPSPAPDIHAEWNEQLRIVKRCLLELKPRTREIFIARVIEQLSYKEIAEGWGVSIRTVERELTVAFDLCRTRLKAYRNA